MKQIIKNLYKENFIQPVGTYDFINYYYFFDEHQQVFGLLKEKLQENERLLIAAHYMPLDPSFVQEGKRNLLNYLFGEDEDVELTHLKYYFVKVFTPLDPDLDEELKNLLKESFEGIELIVKKEDIYIIVTQEQDQFDFYQLLKSIESDFLIKILGYQSHLYAVTPVLPTIFQYDFENIKHYKYTDDLELTKAQLVTQTLINQLSDEDKSKMKHYILNDFIKDHEMLKLIKVYFETNFNTSLAAKICYMHRNTFLNKIDKFIHETTFNIRNYDDALVVYLAIIL